MNLTFEERVKACAIAAALIEKIAARFTPQDKPRAKAKDTIIQVAEHVFRGSSGDEIVLQIKLQWCWMIAGSLWREPVPVHARYKIVYKPAGRVLHLEDVHLPKWEPYREGDKHVCLTCGPDFVEHDVIVQDTSLHEF